MALIVLGVVLLLTLVFDVLWTVVASGAGAGPLTGRLSALRWRLALRGGRAEAGPRHRFLAFSGVAIVVALLVVWIVVAWGAWWLIYSASKGAVRVVETGRPADLVQRLWFSSDGVFTTNSGDLTTGSGAWRASPTAVTATGLVFITLAITYLIPVASAAAERRQLAAHALLRWGVAPSARPDNAAVAPLSQAVGLFLETIRPTFVADVGRPLDPPDLDVLRDAGIPVVDAEEFAAALERQDDRRCLLASLLRDDGWSEAAWRRRRACVLG